MLRWILPKEWLKDKTVERNYVELGAEFGDALSYSYMGEAVGLPLMLNSLAHWEKEYARRGYRPVSINRFVSLGGYGKSIDDVIGKKRTPNEVPVLHASNYLDQYNGIKPAVDLEKMMEDGKPQSGSYDIPGVDKN